MNDMLSTYSSSGPFWHVLWHVLSCSVMPWLCLPWLFPPKPLVRKLMQNIPTMQVVMAAFTIALQRVAGVLVKGRACFMFFWFIFIYVVCLVFVSRFLFIVTAASHVKIYQTSNMKESGSMTFWGLQYYTVILATYLLQIFGLIV